MLGERKFLSTACRRAVILAPLLVVSLFWASYRNHASSPDPAKAVTAVRLSAPSSMSERPLASMRPAARERARGAGLIQTAALLGYAPARGLLARNYPQSEAVRSVVPAKDVIRYALGSVMDAAATGQDSKQIFLAIGQHFALQGEVDLFAAQILISLRGHSRPQLGYRIDTLLDLLARVPGACSALARLIPGEGGAADRECSFSQNLRKHIETTAPAREEEESKRRSLLMLKQLGRR
jgi:hypothetical protein